MIIDILPSSVFCSAHIFSDFFQFLFEFWIWKLTDFNLNQIAFDLHHVVVRPNRLSMLLSVVLFPHMFHVVFYLLFHPRALIGLIIELFTFQHPEKILRYAYYIKIIVDVVINAVNNRDSRISKYKQLIDWLSPLFENIVNSQELNHDVVRIIDELKGNEKRIGSAVDFFLIFSLCRLWP
jgi:hypothetical protein